MNASQQERLCGRLFNISKDIVKTKELIRTIEQAGWTLHRITGSHHIYKHPSLPGRVVIPVHGLNRDMAPGTVLSILKQAGLR